MAPMDVLTVWLAALMTSTLSGVLGMGGGVILMLVLLALMPVPQAMVLHGIVQFVANGTRAATHREHVWWRSVGWYSFGSGLAVIGLMMVKWLPDKRMVYMMGGMLPLLQFLPIKKLQLDIARTGQALVCGGLMTVGQVAAGAAGPLLDAFFTQFDRGRYGILATKSATQVVAHSVKVGYFLSFGASMGTSFEGAGCIGGAALMAVIGTGVGTKLLERISDRNFARFSRGVLVVLSIYSFAKVARG